MDKFSIYEFMSFFLPGVLLSFLAIQLLPNSLLFLNPVSELIDGLLFTIISLILGLVVHRITFLLLTLSWYQKLIAPPIEAILKNNDDFLKDNYEKLNKKHNKKEVTAATLFDKAYYYLEYHDKIATTKMFQSMYFFLRNATTISIISIPLLLLMIIFSIEKNLVLKLLFINILSFPLIVYTARFYRTKMVDRVFNSYIVSKQYDKKQKK